MTFTDLNLITPLLSALDKKLPKTFPHSGQKYPTPARRKDIFGCAQTGTGKPLLLHFLSCK